MVTIPLHSSEARNALSYQTLTEAKPSPQNLLKRGKLQASSNPNQGSCWDDFKPSVDDARHSTLHCEARGKAEGQKSGRDRRREGCYLTTPGSRREDSLIYRNCQSMAMTLDTRRVGPVRLQPGSWKSRATSPSIGHSPLSFTVSEEARS